MPSGQPRPPPPLLRLPLELRQQIYAHLLPRGNVSHPLPSVGITSVSHRLPTAALLNIHPQLTDELLAYFYAITTWKLIFSHAFNFFRVDPDLQRLERCTALRWIRKVEIMFFCDILLLKSYPSFGLEKFCEEIGRRAGRACEVLSQAKELRTVTVSWIDTTLTGGWEQKATILRPLRRLAEGRDVTFRIGEINGPEDVDRETFVKAMETVLGEGRKLETGLDGAAEEEEGDPSQLRMLAFDVRQGRQRSGEMRSFCRSCDGCAGAAQHEEGRASAAYETLA
ncbi:hypothetical protein LTR36_000912 [Oleoguttula mirabilis]|uniref:Uncharacterized protein n=1 Tax=Oleoguttula mirabilis TaxID=1507867 RepID=A0AAV9JNW7_9PEZI|nr:hypothetical protein LTR36_000912 [Oleoguttula mirabilis]